MDSDPCLDAMRAAQNSAAEADRLGLRAMSAEEMKAKALREAPLARNAYQGALRPMAPEPPTRPAPWWRRMWQRIRAPGR